MGVNRGKEFEDKLREQFEKLSDALCLRLYDVTMGYKNINNPCDLIVYRQGTLNLFECKAIHGNTLNFKSHIRDNQWQKLLDYSYKNGVNAGIIVWFEDLDKTFWIDIQCLQKLKRNGKKSFNATNDYEYYYKIGELIEIDGKKKRVFFEYDLEKLLEDISYEW